MRRWWLVLAVAGLAAVGAGVALGSAGHGGPGSGQRGDAVLRGGHYLRYFAVRCGFSHRNMDDPIVFPGQAGLSHDHTFFGNTATNAFSTPAALLGGSTTCRARGDSSAYWVPTLLAGGQPVEPVSATVYYIKATFGKVQPFPAGLKIIAGDSRATTPQGVRVTFWTCGRVASSTIPTCSDGFRASLRLVVDFPNCWDGTSLDSANHKSHLAYSTEGVCPASHPVAVPALAIVVRYPATSGSPLFLASGGQFSGHADFVNAWDQQTLTRLVDRYLNGARR